MASPPEITNLSHFISVNHSWFFKSIFKYTVQVAALAPLALLLVLEARCASIILCCGVVHHCSYTAHVQTCE